MAICDVCGNDYDKSFEIRRGPVTYTFDCFECAIHRLAPTCAHCACRVIGMVLESEDRSLRRELRPEARCHRRRRP